MVVLVGSANFLFSKDPQGSFRTKAKVVKVYDGDTVTVEIKYTLKVRLIDCWAEEIKDKDEEKKKLAIEARDYLSSLVKDKEVDLEIPINESISNSITLNRFLGRIYVENQDVSSIMVEKGFAKKEK